MQESFARNEGKRLSYIFDLNYQTIRKISIALLVVSLSYVVLYIILIIFFINAKKKVIEIIVVRSLLVSPDF